MSKLKYKIIIGFIIIISLIFSVNIVTNISYADTSKDESMNVKKFLYKGNNIKQMIGTLNKNRNKFLNADYSELIGGELEAGAAPYNTKYAYCIDPHEPTNGGNLERNIGYRVVNIIDVKDIDDFNIVKLKDETINNVKKTTATSYKVTGKTRKYLYTYAVLAGLSQDNWEKKSFQTVGDSNTDVYKAYMAYYTWAYGDTMHKKVYLSDLLTPKKNFKKNGYLDQYSDIKDAKKIVDDFMKRRFEKAEASSAPVSSTYTQYEAYSDPVKDATGNITGYVTKYKATNNKWTFIGPYKVRYKKYKIDSIESDCTASEWGWTYNKLEQNGTNTSSPTINKNWKDLGSNKEFYIVIKGDYTGTVNVKLKSDKKKFYSARLLLLAAGEDRQNFAIYVSNEGKKMGAEIDLSGEAKGNPPGDLKIYKCREDSNEAALNGIGFKIRNTEKGYVIEDANGNKSYSQDSAAATEYFTNGDGRLEIVDLEAGNYEIYETKNPHYGYDVKTDGPISHTIINSDEETEITITNPQKRIRISGCVWEDGTNGKDSLRNNQLDLGDKVLGLNTDLNNIWLDNVKVYLKRFERDSNNNRTGRIVTIGNYTTTRDGFYGFDDVEIKYLEDYFVEFEYNGLTYQCVESGVGGLWENQYSSKAIENNREEFNNKFYSIEKGNTANTGVAKDKTGNNQIGLEYTINNHLAKLNNREDYYKEGWNITSNTYNALLNLKEYYDYLRNSSDPSVELTNVNLGLYKRDQPDLAVRKDVQNVQLEINGYGHTYNYDRNESLEKKDNEDGFNVGVKFQNKYTEQYQLPIYKSDYEYQNNVDPSKELKVYITYKVRLKNQATTIDSKINSLIDYYDSTYEKNGGCDIRINENINDKDADGKLKNTISYTKSNYNDKYKKLTIDTKNILIGAQETKNIYIQFGLSREQIASIINDQSDDDKILKNVVEINSYSSYYKGTSKPYGGIDEDSAPGNAVPGDQKTYEDDTDAAPALKLEEKEARKLTGKVFLDRTSGELMTGRVREGDGEYQEGEEGIKDITVTLKPTTEDTSYKTYETTTNENGDFEISGFIPNEYELVYTWGGQKVDGKTITVQDYKGTVIDRSRWNSNSAADAGHDYTWYNENVDTRYSDAKDDYETRENIDSEIKNKTNYEIEAFKTEKENNPDLMNSTTPLMNFKIENTGAKDASKRITTSSDGDELIYKINNVDFGIVERARQEVELKKRVSDLKLTLANGQVISEAKFEYDENGKLKANGETKHMTFIGTTNKAEKMTNNGFIKLELDNELIQGAVLEARYEMEFYNKSELDYNTPEYYWFGEVNKEALVKIIPARIIDYLDSSWSFEESKNQGWKVLTEDDLKKHKTEDPILYTDLNNKCISDNIENRTVLCKESETKVAPTETEEYALEVSKILTTTDDISLENDLGITNIEKIGGRTLKLAPGRYVPEETLDDLSDKAEEIIVTPSTGEDLNFVIPIAIGVIALITLGAGVILIKKKVVDNK